LYVAASIKGKCLKNNSKLHRQAPGTRGESGHATPPFSHTAMHDKLALFLGQADLIPGCRRCKDEGPQDQTGGGGVEGLTVYSPVLAPKRHNLQRPTHLQLAGKNSWAGAMEIRRGPRIALTFSRLLAFRGAFKFKGNSTLAGLKCNFPPSHSNCFTRHLRYENSWHTSFPFLIMLNEMIWPKVRDRGKCNLVQVAHDT